MRRGSASSLKGQFRCGARRLAGLARDRTALAIPVVSRRGGDRTRAIGHDETRCRRTRYGARRHRRRTGSGRQGDGRGTSTPSAAAPSEALNCAVRQDAFSTALRSSSAPRDGCSQCSERRLRQGITGGTSAPGNSTWGCSVVWRASATRAFGRSTTRYPTCSSGSSPELCVG